jgi:hypothetical protein
MTTLKTFDLGGHPHATEPEQLELFSHGAMMACVCHPVCNQISDAACLAYLHSPTVELVSHVRDLLVHNCGGQPTPAPAWYDYLQGAATALNPLPNSVVQNFWLSDRFASALDWQAVQSDVDQVWRTIIVARNLAESGSNDQSRRPERGQAPEKAKRAVW